MDELYFTGVEIIPTQTILTHTLSSSCTKRKWFSWSWYSIKLLAFRCFVDSTLLENIHQSSYFYSQYSVFCRTQALWRKKYICMYVGSYLSNLSTFLFIRKLPNSMMQWWDHQHGCHQKNKTSHHLYFLSLLQ